MNELEILLERNRRIGAQHSAEGKLMPSLPRALAQVKAVVVGCVDPRVDPALVLGIEPGEAVILRNIGGRITPGLLAQLGMLGRVAEIAGEEPGGGGEFHLILLQHTDCGITRLGNESAMLSQYFAVSESEIGAKQVMDPRAAVAADVALAKTIPGIPGKWLVSGLVYDVATGLVEVIVPPASIGS